MTAFDKLVGDLHAASQARETADILAKALEAQRQGLLTGHDVAVIEAASHRGLTVPEEFRKALSAVDQLQAHRDAQHRADDERIAAAALEGAGVSMSRAKLDKLIEAARRDGHLRPGDMARAEAAMNLGKPVPADVLSRIRGKV
ncbi:hypothetical protein QQO24_01720 [Ralstonia pseudosolanacearum]|uniref:hypothetical protein n=1 Tax=Ralstonia pseudosolanacearum TaxID=1310165 RepID=UPI0025B37F22|nr:hypothetical protein [Ralstonia pseudosolanacearum]MDN3365889.1 hypothetical protein [Ralstonia pseudosolanacearum]